MLLQAPKIGCGLGYRIHILLDISTLGGDPHHVGNVHRKSFFDFAGGDQAFLRETPVFCFAFCTPGFGFLWSVLSIWMAGPWFLDNPAAPLLASLDGMWFDS
jgi:hypothetical protein